MVDPNADTKAGLEDDFKKENRSEQAYRQFRPT